MTRLAFPAGKIGYELIQRDKGRLWTSTNVRSCHLIPCSSLQLPHLWRGGDSTHLTWSTRMRDCTILEIINRAHCQEKALWRSLMRAELLMLGPCSHKQNIGFLLPHQERKLWPSWPLRIQKLLSSVTSPPWTLSESAGFLHHSWLTNSLWGVILVSAAFASLKVCCTAWSLFGSFAAE